MAKQHDLIVNRILANYLARQLEVDENGVSIADDINSIGARLCRSDVKAIEKSMRVRFKRLEKLAYPLSEKVCDWFMILIALDEQERIQRP